MLFREVNEQNWTPEASAFFASKTAGNTRQNRRKQSPKSVDASGVQIRSFTSRKSIRPRFPSLPQCGKGTAPLPPAQKMRAPTAPSFTKFHSAHLTRTAESSQNPGAPAGRVLAQNEFRTQRRPLNVAFVLRRTVEQETLYPAPPSGDRAVPATASCLDRRRRRTARFLLGRIYGGQPLRSWRRCRCTPKAVAPLRGSPDAQAS